MKKFKIRSFSLGLIVVLVLLGVVLVAAGVIAALFGGFSRKRYKVDYDGQMSCYTNARETYREGDRVVLYYNFIATDTNYTFTLDGAELERDYDEEKGFVLSFIMPGHDVKLVCNIRNTMLYNPETEPAPEPESEPEVGEVMLFDCYDAVVATVGGDRYDEIVLYSCSDSELTLRTFSKAESDEEETSIEYRVPYEAYDRCMKLVDEYKLRDWENMKNKTGICGGVNVIKFRDSDGAYYRVSSENMPMEYGDVFGVARGILRSFMTDKYRVE
jgi:hypothetical protein